MAISSGLSQKRNEKFHVIQAFSNHCVDTESQPIDFIRAVRDYTNQEQQAEATRLRKYLKDIKLSR